MATMMTPEYLVKLDREAELARATAVSANERRNEAVLTLVDEGGVSQREVARLLGLTPGRVGQIVTSARRHREQASAEPVAA